jgi:protein-S-isoprenylcysteine O-methyltransferase Ste14
VSGALVDRIARRRVPLGFILAGVVLALASPTPASLLIGGAVACVGEGIRVWAAGHLEKGREVTSSGPYRFTRHPLYVGSSIMGIGLALAARSALAAGVVATYLAVTLTAAILREEAFLRREFGGHYDAYVAGRGGRPDRHFSVERLRRNREPRAWLGLAAAIVLLALKAAW